MKQTIVLDVDDLELMRSDSGLDLLVKLKEHYPGFKVTFFMVPMAQAVLSKAASYQQYKDWAKWLSAQDWIEICPHGFMHAGHEMKWYTSQQGKKRLVDTKTANLYIDGAEKLLDELDLPFQKIWKSPHWESSPATLKALWERGYTVAVDPNQERPTGGPTYVYNWSFDKPYPDGLALVKGHGHLYQPNANDVHLCMHNLLQMPADAEFKFVSEVL